MKLSYPLIPVESLAQLRGILDEGRTEHFHIMLNGHARSSKVMYLIDADTIDVFHSISDTWEEMSWADIKADHIGAAIGHKAFIWEQHHVDQTG